MNIEMITSYKSNMFDGEPTLEWLAQAWRALRLYSRKARGAIETRETVEKAAMIDRASRLLVLLSGILDTGPGTKLGPKLMRIYGALQRSLLHANINNDVEALLEFEQAIDALARDMIRNAKIPAAA